MKLALFSIIGDREITPSNIYYLASLKKSVDEIIVLTNFGLSDKDKSLLKETGIAKYHSNTELSCSLSQWAFALSSLENQKLIKKSEEILFCTGNVYGPIYPLNLLWSNDLIKKCDAWGLLARENYQYDQLSEFFVVKRKVIESGIFMQFWNSVNKCISEETIKEFEHLGLFLQKKGFDIKYLLDERFTKLCNTPDILMSDDLLCSNYPFVHISVFRQGTDVLLSDTNASQCAKTFRYLQSKTSYPIDLVVHYLTGSIENSDIIQRLHLAYILSDTKEEESIRNQPDNAETKTPKCALIIFTFYADLFERNLRIIDQVPQNFKIVIVTSNDALFNKWQHVKQKVKNIEVRKQVNRGRNESCYWVTCREIIETYDYICLMHDKKTNYWGGLPVRGYTYAYNAINNLVKSKSYVKNIVDLFEKNKFLGLLMPYPPMFCGLDSVINNPWSSNRTIAEDLYKKLSLRIPFDNCPRAPWGGMFWIRGKAMSSLLRKKWNYDDFPPEPVQADGTILHALERMYPMLAQDAGYLSAFVCPSSEIGSVYFNTYSLLKTRDGQYRQLKSGSNTAVRQDKDMASQSESDLNSPANDHIPSDIASFNDRIVSKKSLYDLVLFKYKRSLIKFKLKKEKKNLSYFFSHKTEIWDSEFYLKENPDVANAKMDPLEHYIKHGWKEGRNPSKECKTATYLMINHDCKLMNISPIEHYYINCQMRVLFWSYSDIKKYIAKHGLEILKKSTKFDPVFFLKSCQKEYGDLPEGFEPYSYYLEHGAYETLNTSSQFDVNSYYDLFPDIKKYGICPVAHYELIGKYL